MNTAPRVWLINECSDTAAISANGSCVLGVNERLNESQRNREKDDVRKDSWEQKIQKLIFISGHMRVECPISVMLLGCHWLPWAYDLLIRMTS